MLRLGPPIGASLQRKSCVGRTTPSGAKAIGPKSYAINDAGSAEPYGSAQERGRVRVSKDVLQRGRRARGPRLAPKDKGRDGIAIGARCSRARKRARSGAAEHARTTGAQSPEVKIGSD